RPPVRLPFPTRRSSDLVRFQGDRGVPWPPLRQAEVRVSLLQVGSLNAGYGRIQVLWDVSIAVEPNQIVALVGANGAGKTTLLRALTGMIRIRSGSITFQDPEIAGSS